MIDRYSRPEMAAVWSDESKFEAWLAVELAACDAHVELGNIPADENEIIQKKAKFEVARILEIEAEVHHDVIAFLTNVAEHVGPASRFVHLGLTSSDVVDTAFSMLIQKAALQIQEALAKLKEALKKQAVLHKHTLMMGRTHGVHAEPTTFGLKCALYYDELSRQELRLGQAIEDLKVGKISGAVGNYAHMPPQLEALVCQKLGLKPANVSTQTLQRDRHAFFMMVLANIGGTLEKMAVEIRSLQKTECNEVQEPFSSKQKGSSAMPHKRNPIISERVTGISRVLRGYALSAMENQALWHERDISHSSAERVIFPDATIILDYALDKMIKVVDGLVVKQDAMQHNIDRSYHVFFSQLVLLALVDKGMLREDAYRLVQRNALAAFDTQTFFKDRLLKDSEVLDKLSSKEIESLFSFERYSQHVDTIYARVFGT